MLIITRYKDLAITAVSGQHLHPAAFGATLKNIKSIVHFGRWDNMIFIDVLDTDLKTAQRLFEYYAAYRGILSERIGATVTTSKRKYTYVLKKSNNHEVTVIQTSNSNPEVTKKIIIMEGVKINAEKQKYSRLPSGGRIKQTDKGNV